MHARTRLFASLLAPLPPKTFFRSYWQRQPVLVQRAPERSGYYNGWFSRATLDAILAEHPVEFTTHLDITSYTDGRRRTHKLVGRSVRRRTSGAVLRMDLTQRRRRQRVPAHRATLLSVRLLGAPAESANVLQRDLAAAVGAAGAVQQWRRRQRLPDAARLAGLRAAL